MGIMEALNEAKYTGRKWKIDHILEGLPTVDADALRAALTDPSVPTNQITVALNDAGMDVTPNTVGTWRRRHDRQQVAA
jgi:hypothetical protein